MAILDVDVHHGNGTQGIFYDTPEIFTASVHADPSDFYPFFWGHADERGKGPGVGANLNVPLAKGSGDQAYLDGTLRAMEEIEKLSPTVIVVALGLDAHVDDPFQQLRVSTDGFFRLGELLRDVNVPLVLVQEGGYPNGSLPHALAALLEGISER